jgi:hypothetical protein
MITQQLIDEWTRHAPASGPERDILIAQRAAQLAQAAVAEQPLPLLERVAKALHDAPHPVGDWKPEARAVIRAIAADARARDLNGKSRLLSWEGVANWLEHEAQQ